MPAGLFKGEMKIQVNRWGEPSWNSKMKSIRNNGGSVKNSAYHGELCQTCSLVFGESC